jgi:hypothetical protein
MPREIRILGLERPRQLAQQLRSSLDGHPHAIRLACLVRQAQQPSRTLDLVVDVHAT